ncbi:hypothetical protein SAMN02745866_01766 [Alteromonadaceae bacterium Bs31]|nr:hypothetical protein SAMN02745866_01766 [Alteromonadaceae bacterium Bs31]
MTSVADSLLNSSNLTDRVNYETGILLNDKDFIAEQTYHRGRLARSLQYLVGAGTAAGLRVAHSAATEATEEAAAQEEKLQVNPGLAIDAWGRLIELPKHMCMRLNRWYEAQQATSLNQAWHAAGVAWGDAPAGVIVDLFIRFLSCEQGKTPSFAIGPFDSVDAVVAERIRDSAELLVTLRSEENPELPASPWPDISAIAEPAEAAETMREAIFTAWHEGDPEFAEQGVLLARVVIEASEPAPGEAPQRLENRNVAVNNSLRPFVLSTNALARWLNLNLAG